jgi:hypothetical protein
MPEMPTVAAQTTQVSLTVSPRWIDALSTLLGSLGPRRWEDVEDGVDYVLSGRPPVPPAFNGGRPLEQALSGYEAAHRIVLAGLGDAPIDVAIRWARLRGSMRPAFARTMTVVGEGLVEILLDDLAETFGAPSRRVPLSIRVLEDMTVSRGMAASAVLLSGMRLGPDSHDPLPSRACLTLTAMRGYDDALIRHAGEIRLHILGFDAYSQVRSAKMLERASTTTLRVYADVIDALARSADLAVRAVARGLQQRLNASRPTVAAPMMTPSATWATLGNRLSSVPEQRHR